MPQGESRQAVSSRSRSASVRRRIRALSSRWASTSSMGLTSRAAGTAGAWRTSEAPKASSACGCSWRACGSREASSAARRCRDRVPGNADGSYRVDIICDGFARARARAHGELATHSPSSCSPELDGPCLPHPKGRPLGDRQGVTIRCRRERQHARGAALLRSICHVRLRISCKSGTGTAPRLRSGAAETTRTSDLLITNQLLYQLSYSSVEASAAIIRGAPTAAILNAEGRP